MKQLSFLDDLGIAAPACDDEPLDTGLARHAAGDWGDIDEDDRIENELAVMRGMRLLSVYHDRNGVREWDRSVTTVLLPVEY